VTSPPAPPAGGRQQAGYRRQFRAGRHEPVLGTSTYTADVQTAADDLPDDEKLTAEEIAAGQRLYSLGKRGLPQPGDPKGGDGRIFHEFDDRHPRGELLVVKGVIRKGFPTRRVQQAVADGLLREITNPKAVETPYVDVAVVLDETRAQAAEMERAQRAAIAATTTADVAPKGKAGK
jgi:hypothetical protein